MIFSRLLEPLEPRIAPAAISLANPLFDVTAGVGQTGTSIDLGKMLDASSSFRTKVQFQTNYTLPGQTSPGVIEIELFDDKAPETVANFLRYINNKIQAADFDGVIFHRLVSGFVLQGGGFNSSDINTHIDTFAPVHNEYDPSDPERSNLIQTVAMAKVAIDNGGGPNSATSEFFVNLADNSSNLNNQNGGFTVFGRVTDASMPVVNAIAGLGTYNGAVPVQNYTSGFPKEEQLIIIKDARIVSPAAGVVPAGTTFEVSIDDGIPTGKDLVIGKLNPATNRLDLSYTPGMAGTATVTVTARNGTDVVTDTFTVDLLSNLIADIAYDGLNSTFVPGDKGTAQVTISNNGGGTAKGTVSVQLYLSKSNGTGNDADGFTLDTEGDDKDITLGSAFVTNVNIASGKSSTVKVKFAVPSDFQALVDGGKYRVLAKVSPLNNSIEERFSDDNVGNYRPEGASLSSSEMVREFDLAFGTVGGRGNISVTVADVDSTPVTFKLTGPGLGTVTKNNDGTLDVQLTGTSSASKLTMLAPKGTVADIDDLFIIDTIGTIGLSNIHLHGHLTASGGAKSVSIGTLGNTDDAQPENSANKTISIGVFPVATQKLAVKFGQVRDYSLQSDMAISTLLATDWLNTESTTAADVITAPSLNSFKVSGDMEASLTLIDSVKLASFSVGGTLRDATIRTLGDIGAVVLGGISGANLFAGIGAQPDELGDFLVKSKIASVQVKGTFADSVISASQLGSVKVNVVDGSAGSSVKGIYADAIKSYLHKGEKVKANLDVAAEVDVHGNYKVQVF